MIWVDLLGAGTEAPQFAVVLDHLHHGGRVLGERCGDHLTVDLHGLLPARVRLGQDELGVVADALFAGDLVALLLGLGEVGKG